MDDIEKLKTQMKWLVILVSAYIVFSTVFTLLLINGINNKEQANEDSIYKIEFAHLMEINHLNISEIKQLSESDARIYCRFSYVDFRFVDRCISDMKTIKEEGQ